MRRLIVLALTSSLAACSPRPSTLLLPSEGGLSRQAVDAVIASHPLPTGENILSIPLGSTPALSNHLVQIRYREVPHKHVKHDLVVTLLRGEGELHIGEQLSLMKSGDTAVIVRGQPHFFVNLGTEPAVAFVTFAPPYAGGDSTPLD